MNQFVGLMAAPFTPFDQNGSLNLGIVPGYTDRLIAQGIKGIFVCGSNGEGPNLSTEERMEVAGSFIKAVAGRMKVFVHVGHPSIRESQTLARHAHEIGADAISSVSAFYFRPRSVKELVGALAEIAASVPHLPFYYYHIPRLTGLRLDMLELLDAGRNAIPSLAGIKYTAGSLWEYQLCKAYDSGRFDVLYGLDEMLLPALSIGARSFIGSTYNFAAPLYYEVIECYSRLNMEEAQKKMLYLVEVVRTLNSYPAIPAQKMIMKRLGLNLGPSRLPLTTLTPKQESQLLKDLDMLLFFEKLSAVTTPSNGQ